MTIPLPPLGKEAISFPHFPTKHQALIFRAYEYVPPKRIAAVLDTTEENVIAAAEEMGLSNPCDSNIWLKKGYITIIRQLWHILPYPQMLSLLGMEEDTFARILREEDFLDFKLGDKPVCEPVIWRALTEEEKLQTQAIKEIVTGVDMGGVKPFDFRYDVADMGFSGKEKFGLRMVYCFSGLLGKAFDVDSRAYCPDEMLEAYQKVGINALWTQDVLYRLTEFPFDPKLSAGYRERLARLRDWTQRCDRYGIKVFLYLNEPRSMPESFYEKYPHLRGHKVEENKICMCTSTKEVQDYLTDSIEFICREVPKIGGFFTITRSENPTNCYSHSSQADCTCPRCKERTEAEVIGEVIGCFEKGAHKVDPDIQVIAWSWVWNEWNVDIINALPDNVTLMSQSERYVPFTIGGVSDHVRDYSMGILGPGENAKTEWAAARKRGLKLGAKLQANTTWEGSTVPALPVYPLVEEHIRRMENEGVDTLMISWTLGGYPSRNLMHAAKYFYENYDGSVLRESPAQMKAAEVFSRAFREFPFHIRVLYRGPQNAGPANLLYLTPTGYQATMTCFAYDDIDTWRSIYPREVFLSQLEKLCDLWQEGVDLLSDESGEMKQMATAAYCLYRSSRNLMKFYMAREAGDTETMAKMATEEESVARKMLCVMNENAAIGFEAANHYYFSKSSILEKIVNCRHILTELEKETIQ